MAIDLKQSWGDASSKISSFNTIKETKDSESFLRKNNANSSNENKSNIFKKQLSDSKGNNKESNKQIKSEVKDQLELLLDLFKESLPKGGNSQSLNTVTNYFLTAANETKEEISNILVDTMITCIGCSEEQSYGNKVNQPIYIKVKQTDLFSQLKTSPEDEAGKFLYEKSDTQNGTTPYSMNRQLYSRLQSPNQSFFQSSSAGNGQNYIGSSQFPLFDIEFVQNYTNPSGVLVTGDFFKVTLNNQSGNTTTISDFLIDYFTSIDILNFDQLSTNLMNMLTGGVDYSLGSSTEELKNENNFFTVLKRVMGICSDPSKKIDVAGNAKLSDIDLIDDSFFEPTRQEDALSDKKANQTKSGVVEFEDCGNVILPVNTVSERFSLQNIFDETKDSKKISRFEKFIDDMSNDPNWGGKKLEIKASFQTSLITKLPLMIFKTIMSPKVLVGFLTMVKATENQFSQNLDNSFDDSQGFMKTFKRLVVDFIRKVYAVFVEKLFEIVKANIKQLVQTILLEIVKETKIKQLRMYSTIIYILSVIGQSVIDYRNCKSVIDEILKLLNLALGAAAPGLSPFILASSKLLSGVSDTRSMSNVIENLQKSGLPTGPAPDGGPNLMNIAMSSMIKGQNKEMAENGKTQIFIPPLTITPAGVTLPTTANGKSY